MLDNDAMTGNRSNWVLALHAGGAGLLLVSGWLGGEMVFRHRLAVAGTREAAGLRRAA